MAETLADNRRTDTIRMPRNEDGAWKEMAKTLSSLSPNGGLSNRSTTKDKGTTFINGKKIEKWFTTLSTFESAAIEYFRPSDGSTDDFVDIINRLAWPRMNQRRHDLLRKRHAGEFRLTLAEARELIELQSALNVQFEPYFRSANQALDKIISRLEERLNDGQRDPTTD